MAEMQEQIFEAPVLPIATARIEEDKWLRDQRAFFRMLPELLKTLKGKWVAVHGEKVIEVGDSMQSVLTHVRERLPKGELYIQLVDEKLPVAKMLSPRNGRR
jgi:hypothetical protein